MIPPIPMPRSARPGGYPAAPSFLDGLNKGLGRNSNALIALGSGLLSGRNFSEGLAAGGQGWTQGSALDQQYADAAEKKQKLNDTEAYLAEKFPALYEKYKAGAPMDAVWSAAMKGDSEGFTLGAGQTRYDAGGNVLATSPDVEKPPAAPSGYRYGEDGNLSFIPGGPSDPATAGKTTEATRRNQQLASVIVPELQSLIGDGTNPGTFDALTSGVDMGKAAIPGAQAIGLGPSSEYQQAQNSLKTIIASYLYSVSGATANPGEVETQASVLTPKFNESPASVAAKKQRIIQMVEAVKAAATGTPISINGGAAPSVEDLLQKYQ